MNINEQLSYLKAELSSTIESFSRKRHHEKRLAFRLKIASVVFASIITILLGLKVNIFLSEIFKNTALILGSVITVINAIEAFYNYRSLWIRRTVTLARLKSLQRDLTFHVSGIEKGEVDPKKIDEYLESYNHILNDDLSAWLKLRDEENMPKPSIKKLGNTKIAKS